MLKLTYIETWLRNLNNEKEVKLNLPMDEEELIEALKNINVCNEEGELIQEYIIPAWNFGEYASELDCRDFANIELENIFTVNAWAEELAEVDSEGNLNILQAIAEASGGSIGEILEIYNKGYYQFYQGMNLTDVAEELVNDCYNLPDFALRYFDFESFGRDLGFDGYVETSNGVIYIE
mgnify:FL=1